MKMLPDSLPIRSISIPGTHDSAARHGGDSAQTQSLSITQQLNGGIRFLDIRLRHASDKFSLYHGFISQKLHLDAVLNEARTFLINNPSETIFMRLRKEYKDGKNTRSWQETYNDYVNEFSDVMWTSSEYDPELGSVRGRIIVLDDMGSLVSQRAGIYYGNFNKQDDFKFTTNWDLYSKWIKVKNLLKQANNNQRNAINFLSGSGGSFPYFIASGHSSPSTFSPRLLTGKTTPGWKNSDPDFPRISCFIGICSIAFEGTNVLTKQYIQKYNPSYVGIIAADFPGDGLISSIIYTNPFARAYFYTHLFQKLSCDD
ncbi:phosphatidylinositol-specific phospholipase C [Parashewanella spongiae]|nr:phosphatidylinositol-specific phospholipase C [Parashewanella spongiae]MCL1079164.1 phosphatidylinositol-specific phospholipase C [Parashewanella spongiae]